MPEYADIIIPTLGHPHLLGALKSLNNVPFEFSLFVVRCANSWPAAVNIGLRASKWDVLIMDDDVRILPDTLKNIDTYYEEADIFGFGLCYEDGRVQHGGGVVSASDVRHVRELGFPRYVPHVTASLCMLKRNVVEKMRYAEDYPGMQYEDVDFSFRALDNGFRIFYIPDAAIHLETQTKRALSGLREGRAKNMAELKRRFPDFSRFSNAVQQIQPD